MTIRITAKNIDIGDSLRGYVDDRVNELSEKYMGTPLTGHVTIEKVRNTFVTGCNIQLRTGLVLQARGEAGDAYASAETAFEKLEKRIRRYKRRLKDHHQAATAAAQEANAMDYVVQATDEDGEDIGPDGEAPLIIAETKMTVREIPVSEAVMQLDLAETPLVVFRNAGHGRLNVVYRREDGHIGWIDPAEYAAS
ncbi:MAG: ribosome hibernation-promoting factor, HPF/YfiA family [Hyphomicrobiaceae bacterium]